MDTDSLARALDDEFKRVAKAEDISMESLVAEVAAGAGCTPRQVYNYRFGKWPIPSSLIPTLCQRFRSTLLLDVLSVAVRHEINSTIDIEDAWHLSKALMRRALDHAEKAQAIFSGAEFSKNDLIEFSQLTDSITRDTKRLYSFAEIAYERAQERKTRTA
jgi:hypothetical protein